MTSPQRPPLPNAADKATLKRIATQVILDCPGLNDTAHEVATTILKHKGVHDIDPDHVYFHRFKKAQSNPRSFTGWEHTFEKPYESLTLTQLVIHRFRATDQDNADLLDLYGGFYTAGPQADTFNESNEVRLHGNEVLKAFWAINFSDLYRNKLDAFWNNSADDFRTLAKCNFLGKAVAARDSGLLNDEDFHTAVSAVNGPLTWPVSLQTLQSHYLPHPAARVCALDIAGHVATNILRIVDHKGRQIIYTPGEPEAFHVLETPADLHWWVLQQLNRPATRQVFLNRFALLDRQQMNEGITDLMNRLVDTWGHSDHHLINQHDQRITIDPFNWLRDSTQAAMYAEADLSLTSNGDLRKKLWIGYLSAGLKVFGPMAAVGWPVALPVIGASLANMGLNIDQAVNGKTASERKQGVIGAIFSAIDALFNLPFLKGAGSLAEEARAIESIDAIEPAEPTLIGPVPEEGTVAPPVRVDLPPTAEGILEIPQSYQSNELLDGLTPIADNGKYAGVYRLDSDPPFAILMNDSAYYVRYFADSQGGGIWAIVDPARPNQLIHSLPVQLNAEGYWERLTKLGLKGGGQCLGKPCTVELELDAVQPAQPPIDADPPLPVAEPEPLPAPLPEPEPEAPFQNIRLVKTPYDVDPFRFNATKRWALQLRETHIQVEIAPDGSLVPVERYGPHFADKARSLFTSAGRFDQNLQWSNLPPRPSLPTITAAMTPAELISEVLRVSPGLVIGETLGRITSMRLLIENMPMLAKEGVKTLYVRRLLNDFAQADLNAYFKSGVMDKDLQTYLTGLGSDPAGQFDELSLVKTARQNGIRVQGTECAAFYRKPNAFVRVEEQMANNHLTSEIMATDKLINDVGKWVVVTGIDSSNTFRNVPGLSELEGGVGLRIEEVDPGHGETVSIDPGTELQRGPRQDLPIMRGTADTFAADIRLQIEAPMVSRNEQQIRRLLYRRGMFLFQGTHDDYTLFHRSGNDMIVSTPVEVVADGVYSIHRPAWATVSDRSFRGLEAMSHELESLGLDLQSRLPG